MNCPGCDATIPDDTKFCGECGAALRNTDEPVAQQGIIAADMPSPQGVSTVRQVRPWVRYWARMFDLFVFSTVVTVPVGLVGPDALWENDLLLGVVCLLAWVFVEPLLLSTVGTTPGKWILKTKIVPRTGTTLSYSVALSRSFKVWWRGLFMGIPLISLITLGMSYRELKNEGETSWDRDCALNVIHQRIGPVRPIIVLGVVPGAYLVVLVISVLLGLSELSPTESRLKTLLENSSESAERIAADEVNDRDVTHRCIELTEAARTYCSRMVIRDPSVEEHPDGEDWLIQWRLDFVRPDHWHVSQEAWDPELGMLYDEWVTVGETNFQNAGFWSQTEDGRNDELNQQLLVDGLLVALQGGESASSEVVSVEGTRYLILEYDQPAWITPCSALLADSASGRCEVEIWIDLETDFLAKGVYRLGNEEGYFEIHHAFSSYNENVVVEPPPWLNLEPDENGNLVVTREEVPVLEHHP